MDKNKNWESTQTVRTRRSQHNRMTELSRVIRFSFEANVRRTGTFSAEERDFRCFLPLLWRLTEKHASAYVCRRNRRGLSEFSVDIEWSVFFTPLNSNIKWKSSLIWATKQEKSTPLNRRFLWLWKFLMNKNTVRFGFQHISSPAFVHIKFVCFV